MSHGAHTDISPAGNGSAPLAPSHGSAIEPDWLGMVADCARQMGGANSVKPEVLRHLHRQIGTCLDQIEKAERRRLLAIAHGCDSPNDQGEPQPPTAGVADRKSA